uniref:Uncharacterized protein n=1 Tax=Chenopodium quinoa TaxID=63459 RepID=A0A803N6H2_CHEQI
MELEVVSRGHKYYCGIPVVIRTSWTQENPGRKFKAFVAEKHRLATDLKLVLAKLDCTDNMKRRLSKELDNMERKQNEVAARQQALEKEQIEATCLALVALAETAAEVKTRDAAVVAVAFLFLVLAEPVFVADEGPDKVADVVVADLDLVNGLIAVVVDAGVAAGVRAG